MVASSLIESSRLDEKGLLSIEIIRLFLYESSNYYWKMIK